MALRWKGDEVRQGWEPATKVVLGDPYASDGTPNSNVPPLCPKTRCCRVGNCLTPKIGIELEAYAFICTPDGRITPYDTPGGVGYSTGNFADPRRFTDAIWNKAQDIGLPLDVITAE